MPRSWAAGAYERKSSVTNRSGAKASFFRSLPISLRAACLLRLDWTSTSRNLGVDGAPEVRAHRFLDRFRQDAGSHGIGPKWFPQRRTVRDRDAALREQVLDVTKAQREPEIEPDRLMYDSGGTDIRRN
jgi:hypothetical protein